MKANKSNIGQMVDKPKPGVRFYLFHGPDEGQSRALGNRLCEALSASRFLVSAAAIKSDPASLADAAGAMNLFGGVRAVWIEPATRDIEAGVVALLEGPGTENPVIAIAGQLNKASPLLKLAESSPLALAFAAWAPEGKDAERMVIDLGRRFGLKIAPAVAARVAETGNNDQAIIAQELEKLGLYLDASPHTPKELHHDAIDAVGADHSGGDFLRLADLALSGNVGELADQLTRLPAGGSEAIPALRSLQRRLLMMAPMRARLERGERVDAVMASGARGLFGNQKSALGAMLGKWRSADLATMVERSGKLERELMFTDAPPREALGEELLAIARKARTLS
jgi:DNA polymerase-3 subunit delta